MFTVMSVIKTVFKFVVAEVVAKQDQWSSRFCVINRGMVERGVKRNGIFL